MTPGKSLTIFPCFVVSFESQTGRSFLLDVLGTGSAGFCISSGIQSFTTSCKKLCRWAFQIFWIGFKELLSIQICLLCNQFNPIHSGPSPFGKVTPGILVNGKRSLGIPWELQILGLEILPVKLPAPETLGVELDVPEPLGLGTTESKILSSTSSSELSSNSVLNLSLQILSLSSLSKRVY